MRLRWLITGATVVTTLGLIGGLAGIGVDNLDKPEEIYKLKEKIQDTIYPPIPPESRVLPKIGPSLPSPGYEN